MTEVAQFIEMTTPLPTKTGTSAMQFRIYTYKRDERFRSGDFATDDCAANQCSLKGTVSCARYKTTADVSDTFDNFARYIRHAFLYAPMTYNHAFPPEPHG
ncbi:TPA: hypothetical protein MYO83_002251 [Klebsiella michiganensis]|nr:hypothetical protein [Klebsiella michiganensis]HCB1846677.1 hypothetical protein [Klebsiella oxytoca]